MCEFHCVLTIITNVVGGQVIMSLIALIYVQGNTNPYHSIHVCYCSYNQLAIATYGNYLDTCVTLYNFTATYISYIYVHIHIHIAIIQIHNKNLDITLKMFTKISQITCSMQFYSKVNVTVCN